MLPQDETYEFLQEDLEALNARIASLKEEMRRNRAHVAATSEQSSESWHDNPMFDYNNREFDLLTRQYSDLVAIAAHAIIVTRDPDRKRVGIGSIVTFMREGASEPETIQIGSYRVAADDTKVSYVAPVAKLLLGAKQGEKRSGLINQRQTSVTILEIN